MPQNEQNLLLVAILRHFWANPRLVVPISYHFLCVLFSSPQRPLPETPSRSGPQQWANTPLFPRGNATFSGWGAARGLEAVSRTGKNEKFDLKKVCAQKLDRSIRDSECLVCPGFCLSKPSDLRTALTNRKFDQTCFVWVRSKKWEVADGSTVYMDKAARFSKLSLIVVFPRARLKSRASQQIEDHPHTQSKRFIWHKSRGSYATKVGVCVP